MKNSKYIVPIFLIALLISFWFSFNKINKKDFSFQPGTKSAQVQVNSFSYKGKEELDALTLLKEKTSVEQNNSGMVISINGRKADSGRHEYWAFYVNGKMASVGAADYKTKDNDRIEWKIEKY